MNKNKYLDISDKMNEVIQAVESMHAVTILLLDGMKANRDETGERLLYCYYRYIDHLYGLIKKLSDQMAVLNSVMSNDAGTGIQD